MSITVVTPLSNAEPREYVYTTRVQSLIRGNIHMSNETLVPTSRLFGVELEVVVREPYDKLTILRNDLHPVTKQFAIMKSDATLGPRGLEIVSAPATHAAHRWMWDRFFWKTAGDKRNYFNPPLVTKNGVQKRSKPQQWVTGPARFLNSFKTNVCGMHIHFSRNSCNPATLVRLWNFINKSRLFGSNLTEEGIDRYGPPENFIDRIAGRRPTNYCFVEERSLVRAVRTGGVMHSVGHSSRHAALHLNTVHSPTCELRIFRGNTDPIGFQKNIDFCASLIEFCETLPRLRATVHITPDGPQITYGRGMLPANYPIGAQYVLWVTSPQVASRYPFFNMWVKRHKNGLLYSALSAGGMAVPAIPFSETTQTTNPPGEPIETEAPQPASPLTNLQDIGQENQEYLRDLLERASVLNQQRLHLYQEPSQGNTYVIPEDVSLPAQQLPEPMQQTPERYYSNVSYNLIPQR